MMLTVSEKLREAYELKEAFYELMEKEKKDRQQFVYPLPQHLTKNQIYKYFTSILE